MILFNYCLNCNICIVRDFHHLFHYLRMSVPIMCRNDNYRSPYTLYNLCFMHMVDCHLLICITVWFNVSIYNIVNNERL